MRTRKGVRGWKYAGVTPLCDEIAMEIAPCASSAWRSEAKLDTAPCASSAWRSEAKLGGGSRDRKWGARDGGGDGKRGALARLPRAARTRRLRPASVLESGKASSN